MTEKYPIPGVALVLFNRDGDKILLAKRLLSSHENLKYGCPGGKVENGHTLLETVYKELQEETGLEEKDLTVSPKMMGFISSNYYSNIDQQFICLWFSSQLKEEKEICFIEKNNEGKNKTEKWGFFSLEDIKNLDLMTDTYEVVEKIINRRLFEVKIKDNVI